MLGSGKTERKPFKKDDIVRHFKRDYMSQDEKEGEAFLYRYLGICIHTETGESLCVYESLVDGSIYARPKEMFYSEVDHEKFPEVKQKYRLEKVKFD